MEKLYTVTKTRLGADCGSDHELLIAKFRLKLKKVEKATRPFRYDLTPARMAIIKNLQIINAGEGVEKKGPSYTAAGNVNWYSHSGGQYRGTLRK